MDVEFHSPAWQTRVLGERAVALGPFAVRIFSASPVRPLRELAARAGFWTLGKGWLESFAGYIGCPIASGSSHFETWRVVTQAALPDASETDVLDCMERRLVVMHKQVEKSEAQYTDIPDLDDVLEKRDEKKVKGETKSYEVETCNLAEFSTAFREQAAKLRPRPQRGSAEAKAAARKYPRNIPKGEIPHAEAKLLAPAEGLVWRNLTAGAWCGKYGAYPELSRSWLKWTERGALLAVLRQLWMLHLTKNGATTSACPIRNLFCGEDGEAASSSVTAFGLLPPAPPALFCC